MTRPGLRYVYLEGTRWRFKRRRPGGGYRHATLPGDPHTDPEAAQAYWRLMSGQEPKPDSRHHLRAVIDSYKRSPAFARLAPRTRADYDKVLCYIADRAGHLDVRRITRPWLIDQHAAARRGKRFADYMVTMFGLLFEHARDRGLVTMNPAEKIRKHGTQRGYKAWPRAVIERYREAASGPELTAFELALGTGQRIGDVLEMRWDRIEEGGIPVRQGKTGEELWIPFTAALAAHLDTLPRSLTTIVCRPDGRPYSYRGISQRMRDALREIGGGGHSFHGLRYNAASELAEAGCSDAVVAAVTGHRTRAMVVKYTRQASQRRLAREGQGRRK